MNAISRPLLCAFAGGCLSNAVLFGLWRAADGMSSQPAQQQHRSHEVAQLVATAAPSVEQAAERVSSSAPEVIHEAAPAPVADQTVQEADGPAPAPAGSAVSDVLMGLEAAYRDRVAAAPPQRPAIDERATVPAVVAMAIPEPPTSPPPAPPVAEANPVVPVAATAALEARPAAPVAVDPVPPPPVAPPITAAPAYVAEAPPPTEIHYGDVNQNTYNITNVRQGDVYLVQLQQLAMLQYMLGASPAVAAPARRSGGSRSQYTAFPSGITNPDNPWGFRFAPPHLVR